MRIDNENLSWVLYKKLHPDFQVLEDAGILFFGDIEDEPSPAPASGTSLTGFVVHISQGWGMDMKYNRVHFHSFGDKEKLILRVLIELTKIPVEELVKYLTPSQPEAEMSPIDRTVHNFVKMRLGDSE
jgi:hypothetical protein